MTTERTPGDQAEVPTQIPPRGWWQITRRALKESGDDNVSMLAAGVAFFAFLAIFPTLIAVITLYGLIADPTQAAHQAESFVSSLPEQAQPIVTDQLNSVAAGSGGALTLGLVVSLLAALWAASSGTSNLMKAVNLAYDEKETRGFVRTRGIALLLTFGAILFVLLALTLVAVVPTVLDALHLGLLGLVLAQVVRWGLLVVLVVGALGIVYRMAPDRDAPKFTWVGIGAVVATLLWIIGSVGFSLYANNFGSYNKTYGAIAGVIVLLLWLYLTSYVVLLGAEINAESERQTRKDTTRGQPAPMGERRAVAADEIAGETPDRDPAENNDPSVPSR